MPDPTPSTGPKQQNNAFVIHNDDALASPVLISIPHGGRAYPDALLSNLAVPQKHLLRLEDRYVDRVADDVLGAGYTMIVAHRPRAWIDLNRAPGEIDPAMISGMSAQQFSQASRKVRGGLGLIPSRLSSAGRLWREKWQWQDVQQRLTQDHEPYHAAISARLQRIKAKFGVAILLDLHSMPPLPVRDGMKPANFIVGDRFGRSAASRFSHLALSFADRFELLGALNHPYAGGYVLDRHGDPERDIHALQVELSRDLYLNEDQQQLSVMLPSIARKIRHLVDALSDEAQLLYSPQAAE